VVEQEAFFVHVEGEGADGFGGHGFLLVVGG
jgi:hypothetical protein